MQVSITLPSVTTTPTSGKSVSYCVRFDDLTPYKINRLKNRFESNFLSLPRSVEYDTILVSCKTLQLPNPWFTP